MTWPGVRLTTGLVVILSTIVGANFFTEPYLLTRRRWARQRLGVAGAPDLPGGDRAENAGYAAAIGVMLAVAVMVLAVARRLSEGS